MTKQRIDSRAIGLEVGNEIAKWLTGAENLHYGLWDELEVNAGNLGRAQSAYTDKLFGYLPEGQLSILDIGGGAGETARKLLALGHQVQIVVPSAYLADRCRANAPGATVHLSTFEEFETQETFDLCLFSESFQYIPMDTALLKALGMTKPGGHVLIADCFRSDGMVVADDIRPAGGGHNFTAFQAYVETLPVERVAFEEITTSVAPSIDLEQSFFHVFGNAIGRIDDELSTKRPKTRGGLMMLLRTFMGKRKMHRLNERLRASHRTSENFIRDNHYVITKLKKSA
ncbi:class I SAM-dependent methyltransferase [Pseudooceanicola sp. MF1-13]|uniref:class I SAM-dependent methyltransferase n=1 Tax=Pseudooceanicola sp. MF1-13 TaxID=3379095 RepID=UPI003891EC76